MQYEDRIDCDNDISVAAVIGGSSAVKGFHATRKSGRLASKRFMGHSTITRKEQANRRVRRWLRPAMDRGYGPGENVEE